MHTVLHYSTLVGVLLGSILLGCDICEASDGRCSDDGIDALAGSVAPIVVRPAALFFFVMVSGAKIFQRKLQCDVVLGLFAP